MRREWAEVKRERDILKKPLRTLPRRHCPVHADRNVTVSVPSDRAVSGVAQRPLSHPGQAHDLQGSYALLPGLLDNLQILLADKTQNVGERVLFQLKKPKLQAVIQPKARRTEQREYDEEMYKWRHLIENFSKNLSGTSPSLPDTINVLSPSSAASTSPLLLYGLTPAIKTPAPLILRGAGGKRSLAMADFSMSNAHTIIGAAWFHGRVRDGVGWFPRAKVARRKGAEVRRAKR